MSDTHHPYELKVHENGERLLLTFLDPHNKRLHIVLTRENARKLEATLRDALEKIDKKLDSRISNKNKEQLYTDRDLTLNLSDHERLMR